MKGRKAGGSKPHHDVTIVKDTDDASSHTAVTIDSDSDASSTITLVDFFPGLTLDSDEAGDTSAESTDATSSQISSSADKPSTDGDSEACAKEKKSSDVNCLVVRKQRKKSKAAQSETESAESSTVESTSGEESTSEGVSSEASGSKPAMAESTTSGETSSAGDSQTDGASSSADASSSGDASSNAPSSNPGNWTPSEDALILSMKEGGETWASIGNAINRGKNEVKKRWHVVKANNANSTESGNDAKTETEKTEDSTEEKKPEAKTEEQKPETKAEKKQKKKAKQEQTTECTKKKTKEPKQKEAKEDAVVECTKAKTKEHKQRHKKAAKEEPAPEESESEEEDDENSSSSYRERINLLRDTESESDSSSSATSEDDADKPGYYERELVRQERYIRRHVHPALYPPKAAVPVRAPSPADKQQRRDDKVLAAVASRREATRWLEMQANFFNVTGRMVPLYAIKARCEAEEDRGKAAGVRSWASSVAGSHELLDPSERPEIPDDALLSDED
ncbi:hypothetical protein CkaCkLH20_01425 [Colletotrichum karsti]|uniref:Myb-like domain-containing protein n=1 Tax=Colletotrichum karsti TaxID=1095194 RepID=A0A9P6IJA5_9PEZI|nr:uncharacterized protein CkaCkLH20_01425 [Colletotrichum karsti]KAF9881275.1 hypothetical protein CkaCkLH20_01425 [Colletotrichum karsti]